MKRPVAWIVCVLALGGCMGGLRSQAPPLHTYVLQPPVAVPVPPVAVPVTLSVLKPEPAPGLGSDRIAVLQADGRLDAFADSAWAEDAPALLQQLSVDWLRAGGGLRAVQSDDSVLMAEWLLRLELRHFEADYSAGGLPIVHVALYATLARRADRLVVAARQFESRVPAGANRLQAVLHGFNQATDAALAEMTLWVPEQVLKAAPPARP